MKIKHNTINFNVADITALEAITGMEENDVCVVTDENRGGTFVYRSAESGTNNGGTIFDGWHRQYDDSVNVKWFGAVGDGVTDDTDAIQAAIDTGLPVSLGDGTFLISEELLFTTLGQKFFGNGRGEFFNEELKGSRTIILIGKDSTIPKYRKTRRQAPKTSSDTDDADLSVAINIQAEAVELYGFTLQLECDYTNTSPSNLGGNCDIGIFNGCRAEVKIHDINIMGYFRVASLYLDVTASTTVDNFTTPATHTTKPDYQFPENSTNGSDRIHISSVHTKGGVKGLFLAGAKESDDGTYYDILTDTTYTAHGGRGGSGASDLLIDQNCFFESRDHHSGHRYNDPTMDTSTEDIDNIACCVALDGRRGSTTQARTRRINIQNLRMRTLEAARMFTDRVYELNLNWIHSEGDTHTGTVYNTSGVEVDIYDYTNHSYGPLACVPTGSGINEGTNVVSCFGVWGTGIQEEWSDNLVSDFTHIKEHMDSGSWTPYFAFVTEPTYTLQTGTWTKINNIVFCDFKISYSGLDTADTSDIQIRGLEDIPFSISALTAVVGNLNIKNSTGWDFSTSDGYSFDNISSIYGLTIHRSTGVAYDYNDGQIQASGDLVGSFWFRD